MEYIWFWINLILNHRRLYYLFNTITLSMIMMGERFCYTENMNPCMWHHIRVYMSRSFTLCVFAYRNTFKIKSKVVTCKSKGFVRFGYQSKKPFTFYVWKTLSKTSKRRITDPLCWESTGHRWIPLTKDQQRGKWFHPMTSVVTTLTVFPSGFESPLLPSVTVCFGRDQPVAIPILTYLSVRGKPGKSIK